MLNRNDAKKLVEKAVSSTKYYAVATLSASSVGTTRFANSEISQNVTITEARMSLCIYDGKKQATCATNVISNDGLEQLARDAEALLKYVPASEYGAFAFSQEPVAERDVSKTLAAAFDTQGRAAYIKKGVALLEDGYTASGALTFTDTTLAIGESSSFEGKKDSDAFGNGGFRYANYHNIAFNTVVTHESGADGAGECTSYTTVPDVVSCFAKAQKTAKAALNPVEPPLGAVTVVLSPAAFADLLSFTVMQLNAKSVEDGVSFARGKLGEKVFGENIIICDDVTNPDLLPLPFDYEGNVKCVLPLINSGVIENYVYDNKRAAKAGVKSTGHAVVARWYAGAVPMNVVVDGGEQTLDEIISNTENGIFINEFHYTNFVNARNLQITGLTRNGTFLIENGKITKPISTVRFTESMLDAFCNISAVSKEREIVGGFGAMLVPAVRVEGFHFTSRA